MVITSCKMLSLFVFLLLLLCASVKTQAQPVQSNLTGYTCPDDPSPCSTYAYYEAKAPYYLDLVNISALFGVSKSKIAKASDLSSETLKLEEGQPLLIPITCGCMGNYSQANITYQIKKGDTFSMVSTENFQYLTTYQAVEVANPTLIPEKLFVGINVTFPIRCQCPSKVQRQKGINMQITYVGQTGDTLESISKKFGANLKELSAQNVKFDYTLLVPVSKKPTLAQSPSAAPSPSAESPSPSAAPSPSANNSAPSPVSLSPSTAPSPSTPSAISSFPSPASSPSANNGTPGAVSPSTSGSQQSISLPSSKVLKFITYGMLHILALGLCC